MKKRGFIFIICIIIIAIIINPAIAFGYTKNGEGEAALLQEGEYDVAFKTHKDYSEPLRSGESAEDYVYARLLAKSSEINVSSYSIDVDDIDAFFSNVVNDHPDLFYVSSSVNFSYYPSTNTIAKIRPLYAMDLSEIDSAMAIFNSGKERALSEVDDSMTDLQKAVVLHDYICNLANYPNIFDENGNFDDSLDRDIYHSAYGFFLNQTVVCAGYTLTYSYLLNELGIPCEYVASNAMSHAWNKVYINGSWYNADLTYDDFDRNNGETTYGSVRHEYFLKSDSYFSSGDSIAWHFGGLTTDSCPANNTDNDDAFWNNITSRIFVVNGKFYYLMPTSNFYNVYLKERSANGVESSYSVGFNTMCLNYSGGYYDENGGYHSYSYKDALGRLAYLDGKFYVSANTKLYSVVGTTKYTVLSLGSQITGLSANEKGNLYYHNYDNTFSLSELDKLQYFKNHITKSDKTANYNNFPDVNNDNVVNGKDYAPIIKARNS